MSRHLIDVLKDYGALPEYLREPTPSVHSRSLFGDYPISIAAVRGIIADLQVLLNAGANIDQPGENGFTPLHYAAMHGHSDTVLYLLNAGVAKNSRNDDGDTVYEVAETLEEKDIIEALRAE